MIITSDNYTLIGKQFRCHDSLISQFKYNFDKNCLVISFTKSQFTNVEKIMFANVFSYTLTGYDPWGHDCYVFDWQYIDPEDGRMIFGFAIDQANSSINKQDTNLIFSEIVFASGNRIRIACREIITDSFLNQD